MNYFRKQTTGGKTANSFRRANLTMIFASLLTLTATFLISNSPLGFGLKTAIFAVLVGLYLIFSAGFFYADNRRLNSTDPETENPETEKFFSPEVEEKLLVLEEAGSFATSLKFPDMFRLLSNRIAEVIPFSTCVLFLAEPGGQKLKVAQALGENAADFLTVEINCREGLAGRTFLAGQAQMDENLLIDRKALQADILGNFKTAIAVPLSGAERETYGVLVLYNNKETYDRKTLRLLIEVGLRVAPLLLNSLTFERNLENALTDSLTHLPNERAFYLVLENQIAESQRFFEKRPLTVLSIDIKNFDEVNKKYGYPAGDQILTLAAKIIKGQLRQMDFLSRSMGDEFLAVLPTASEEITKVIIDRVEKAFTLYPFEISAGEKIHVQLNFGAASLIKDGETAQDLLKRAILKKQKSKSGLKDSVLWFPHEYLN